MESATARFVEEATALPAATLAEVYERLLDRWADGGRAAGGATRVSASENSSIDRAVRSALLPRVDELEAVRQGLHSDSISACGIAARAVRKRSALTEEQYRVLLAPFVAVGLDAPERDGPAPGGS
ncbi:hypothetical protein [Streptomyces cinereoruber]|uniref:hypothetical protein n=1 Tax=Streptomyces cinereoruber TaxID=67260 RepID=UPI00362D92D6